MPTQEKRPPVLGELASDRGASIDYRDPHSVNYLNRSQQLTDTVFDWLLDELSPALAAAASASWCGSTSAITRPAASTPS